MKQEFHLGLIAIPSKLPNATQTKTVKRRDYRLSFFNFKECDMETNKAAAAPQNIQDVYLNAMRRDKTPITIFLIGGVRLTGRIRGFDKYSVVLESNNQDQLIFKHAISTITTSKPMAPPPPPPPPPTPPAPASQG